MPAIHVPKTERPGGTDGVVSQDPSVAEEVPGKVRSIDPRNEVGVSPVEGATVEAECRELVGQAGVDCLPAVGRLKIRVRIVSEDDAVKEAFKAAAKLREAGYIVEIDLDGKESGVRWIIEVGDKLTLINTDNNRKVETSTVKEVIKLMEGEGGD